MNNKRKPRMRITERYDKEKGRRYFQKRQYSLSLNEREISILKASLVYYLLIFDFTYTDWIMCGGSVGTKDNFNEHVVGGSSRFEGLIGVLDRLSDIKPEYAFSSDESVIKDLLQKELVKQKRSVEAFEDKYGRPPLATRGCSAEELEKIAIKHAEYKKNPEKYDKEWM